MSAASHSAPAPVQQPPVLVPRKAPEKPAAGRPWKWLIILAILLIGAVATYQYANKPAAPSTALVAKTAKVVLGDLERTIRVSGQTSAINFSNVTAPLMRGPDANREMILLKTPPAGSWVKKGTLVAEIDSQSMQDHVDDLKDTIQAAQADVDKRKAEQAIEMENLQQTLRITKSEADKARLDYAASEVRTDIERQLLKLALDEADAAYQQAVRDVDFKKNAQAAEIKILEYTLERHTRHRNRHIRDVQAFSIYASMDGLVVMSQIWRGNEMGTVQVGDRLFPGQQVLKVVNTKTMQLEGTVNQAESGEFRIGQPANLKLDAFPGLEFKGQVHSLGALAASAARSASAYIRTVPIRVKIEGSDPKLIPDLSASGDVIIDRVSGKNIVPRSAISYVDGKAVAYVKSGITFEPRDVTVGLQSDTHAAVLSGLSAGDEVRLN